MKEKKVKRFFADDGMDFATAKECIQYETNEKFNAWYNGLEDGQLYAGNSTVDSDDLYSWIQANKDKAQEIINAA
jgi:hypothetical protein